MVVCTRHRGGSSAGQSSGLIIRRSWVRAPPAPPAILFRISPSLWSDLLVVKDVVARPGTVIVFHQVCDRYMGTSTSPRSRRARGARGVIRNTGERLALHPPLLSSPPQGPAQSACTTMPIGDPPRASLSRQGPGYRARKSALVTHPPKCVARPRRRSRVATGLCSFRGHRGPGGPVKPGLGPRVAITHRPDQPAVAGSPRRVAWRVAGQAGPPRSGDCGLRRCAAIGRALCG